MRTWARATRSPGTWSVIPCSGRPCRRRLARPRPRLGRARGARRPDIQAYALAAPARHRLPGPRHRAPVGLRPALRSGLAHAAASALPSRGPGRRSSSSLASRRWMPSTAPVRCGNSPWSRRRGGADRGSTTPCPTGDGAQLARRPERKRAWAGRWQPMPALTLVASTVRGGALPAAAPRPWRRRDGLLGLPDGRAEFWRAVTPDARASDVAPARGDGGRHLTPSRRRPRWPTGPSTTPT